MLNKELLVLRTPSKDYTHIVTVGVDPDTSYWFTYGVDTYSTERYGNITPRVFEEGIPNRVVWKLSSNDSLTSLWVNEGFALDTYLYLGRFDTRHYLGSDDHDTSTVGKPALWHNKHLFNKSDVGKQIPIWLATTPPPWAS